MIRTQRITASFLVGILLLLTCCESNSNEELPLTEFSQQYVPLRVDTVDELAEIDAWKIMDKGDPISLIQHNLVLNRLTVCSEQTKKVFLFAIDRKETISQHIVDVPNLRILGVNEEGDKLLIGMSGITWNEQGKPRQYYHWVALWNILSGSIDECFSGSCTEKRTDPDKIENADIGAVMDAETVVAYDEYSYRTAILSPEGGGGVALVNSPDSDYWWHIGKIAVNSDQNRLATVFQEGKIELYKISENNILPFAWVAFLEHGKKNQLQPIQDAAFDPSGNWLAIVRGQDLINWRVKGWKREVFREQIGNVHGIRFNPLGELLFIIRDDAIIVIGIKEKKAVFEMQTPGITSLEISNDNRLLFWGDENGTVHVWGILAKE